MPDANNPLPLPRRLPRIRPTASYRPDADARRQTSNGPRDSTTDCGDSIPDVGQTMHAKTMPSDHPDVEIFFWSPRLKMEYSLAVSITNRDASTIPWAHHEFRVESVEHSPPRLRLAYVRELDESEWKWFTV